MRDSSSSTVHTTPPVGPRRQRSIVPRFLRTAFSPYRNLTPTIPQPIPLGPLPPLQEPHPYMSPTFTSKPLPQTPLQSDGWGSPRTPLQRHSHPAPGGTNYRTRTPTSPRRNPPAQRTDEYGLPSGPSPHRTRSVQQPRTSGLQSIIPSPRQSLLVQRTDDYGLPSRPPPHRTRSLQRPGTSGLHFPPSPPQNPQQGSNALGSPAPPQQFISSSPPAQDRYYYGTPRPTSHDPRSPGLDSGFYGSPRTSSQSASLSGTQLAWQCNVCGEYNNTMIPFCRNCAHSRCERCIDLLLTGHEAQDMA